MVFSSLLFLWAFLPVMLAVYYALPRGARNFWITVASLFFYAWGEHWYTLVMLATIVFNWGAGLLLGSLGTHARRKACLGVAIAGNLALLFAFKYSFFLSSQLHALLAPLGFAPLLQSPLHLPIGLSFFVFQAISYVVDVYRGDIRPSLNLVDYAAYKSLFPQLIAGPIVRYRDVAAQVAQRRESLELFTSGVQRFIVGLAKKVLIANVVARAADAAFDAPAASLGTGAAWLGALAYALQIYFDFSGYSDMAIGLGRMLGFSFKENFDCPYSAVSMQDFWRRWHISLSSWFRDYLYIPLGGNRLGLGRTVLNQFSVFALCGLWHGASWNFLLWGLWHGSFLAGERLCWGSVLQKLPRALGRIYTALSVLLGWVLFRCADLPSTGHYVGALFSWRPGPLPTHLWDAEIALSLIIGLVVSTGMLARLHSVLSIRLPSLPRLREGLSYLALFALFLASLVWLAGSSHNPFIYFRF